MTLRQHVNNSGFPLQLAVADYVKHSSGGWNVLYEEHAWRTNTNSGFIDLVLEDQYKTWLMNIECKRVRDADWVFLKANGSASERRHAKLWVTRIASDESLDWFDWVDVPMDPSSVESAYCVVPGQDPKSRPMLERTAATGVESTEALARQEADGLSKHYSELRIYQNVIVTTAALHVCEFDISEIDIGTGELGNNSKFRQVPYVRFRKQLGAKALGEQRASDSTMLRKIEKNKESTVFIVNSSHFGDFLGACELPDDLERFIHAR